MDTSISYFFYTVLQLTTFPYLLSFTSSVKEYIHERGSLTTKIGRKLLSPTTWLIHGSFVVQNPEFRLSAMTALGFCLICFLILVICMLVSATLLKCTRGLFVKEWNHPNVSRLFWREKNKFKCNAIQ